MINSPDELSAIEDEMRSTVADPWTFFESHGVRATAVDSYIDSLPPFKDTRTAFAIGLAMGLEIATRDGS